MREPGPDHPITVAPTKGRVRVMLGGVIVAETTRALTLKEASYLPVQYIPREDAQMDFFVPSAHTTHCPYKGDAAYFSLTAGGLAKRDAVWSYEKPHPAVSGIKDHLAFYSDRVDAIEIFDD